MQAQTQTSTQKKKKKNVKPAGKGSTIPPPPKKPKSLAIHAPPLFAHTQKDTLFAVLQVKLYPNIVLNFQLCAQSFISSQLIKENFTFISLKVLLIILDYLFWRGIRDKRAKIKINICINAQNLHIK